MCERLFVDHRQGWKEPHAIDALVVHRGEARITVAVLRADRLVATSVANLSAGVTGIVGGGDHTCDDGIAATIDRGPPKDPTSNAGIEVSSKRIERLVIVIIRIKDLPSPHAANLAPTTNSKNPDMWEISGVRHAFVVSVSNPPSPSSDRARQHRDYSRWPGIERSARWRSSNEGSRLSSPNSAGAGSDRLAEDAELDVENIAGPEK